MDGNIEYREMSPHITDKREAKTRIPVLKKVFSSPQAQNFATVDMSLELSM